MRCLGYGGGWSNSIRRYRATYYNHVFAGGPPSNETGIRLAL